MKMNENVRPSLEVELKQNGPLQHENELKHIS